MRKCCSSEIAETFDSLSFQHDINLYGLEHRGLESLLVMTRTATSEKTCKYRLEINIYGRKCLCHFVEYGCNNHGSPLISINTACDQVEFKRISLTGFRSCTSRSRYQSVSKQTTRIRKSPTKSLFDVGSRRISIVTVNTKEYHSDVWQLWQQG
ncbi:hypothetical protein Tco_0743087 [Tanacetum coccineum]